MRIGQLAGRTGLAPSAVRYYEQLGLLPFRVGELAGFRVGGIIPGRAVMLGDAVTDVSGRPGPGMEPHIFVTVAAGGPAQTSERDAFARDALAAVPNLKDIRLTTSEMLRMRGQHGHQIIATARDAAGAHALTVVQWLRFGGRQDW